MHNHQQPVYTITHFRLRELSMLSYKGRIGRGSWWIGQIGLAVTATIANTFLPRLESGQVDYNTLGTVGALAVVAISVLLFWIAIAINARRWHDRDKSGWWSLLYLAAYLPLLIFAFSYPHIPPQSHNSYLIAALIGMLAILLWPLIELGFLRGSDKANRYGARTLSLLE